MAGITGTFQKKKFSDKCLPLYVVASSDQIQNISGDLFVLKYLSSIVASIFLGLTTAGCQILVDNRVAGKTPVVVVPASDWDRMREAEMRLAIEREIGDAEPVERPAIIPIEGSDQIKFSNRTDSNLAGCSTIGIIEVIHKGTMDEAIVVLRNEAYRLNTNVLVPYAMKQKETNDIVFAKIQIEARMMKCPLQLPLGT